jgi:hypothetical protein
VPNAVRDPGAWRPVDRGHGGGVGSTACDAGSNDSRGGRGGRDWVATSRSTTAAPRSINARTPLYPDIQVSPIDGSRAPRSIWCDATKIMEQPRREGARGHRAWRRDWCPGLGRPRGRWTSPDGLRCSCSRCWPRSWVSGRWGPVALDSSSRADCTSCATDRRESRPRAAIKADGLFPEHIRPQGPQMDPF